MALEMQVEKLNNAAGQSAEIESQVNQISLSREVRVARDEGCSALVLAAKILGLPEQRAQRLTNPVVKKSGLPPQQSVNFGPKTLFESCLFKRSIANPDDQRAYVKAQVFKLLAQRYEVLAATRSASHVETPLSAEFRQNLAELSAELKQDPKLLGLDFDVIDQAVSDGFTAIAVFLEQVDQTPAERQKLEVFSPEGRYLKKVPGGAYGTLINTARGKTFELLNQIGLRDQANLEVKYGRRYSLGKNVLALGRLCKVRIARQLDSGEYVAVKKSSKPNSVSREVSNHRLVQSRMNLMGKASAVNALIDHAIVEKPSGDARTPATPKGYMFYKLANRGDGWGLAREAQSLHRIDPLRFKAVQLDTASRMAQALAAMHESGLTHRDVKPENFLVSRELVEDASGLKSWERQIRIGDITGYFPKMLDGRFAGDHTPQYLPPETLHNYNAPAHDAFSLGLSLLSVTSPMGADGIILAEISIPNHPDILPIREMDDGAGYVRGIHCPGLAQKVRQQPTLHGVIACLIQEDPAERMGVVEASKLLKDIAKAE